MASMRDAMVRNLRQFTEQYLSGLVNWERVVIEIPDDHEGDVVLARFGIGGGEHTVRVESPDFSPQHPNGWVLLDGRELGPIDDASWIKAAKLVMRTEADGRQSQPDGASI